MNIRKVNSEFVKNDAVFQRTISRLKDMEHFLEDLRFLTYGRDFICKIEEEGIKTFSLYRQITSLTLTMGSIIACCNIACLADANTLLRKYRDELFFYIYITAYRRLDPDAELAKNMAAKIEQWLKNERTGFSIKQILRAISDIPELSGTVERYRFIDSFIEISKHLNDYVHGNGYDYYNLNVYEYKAGEKEEQLQTLEYNARYMTVVFVFLLILCSPSSVMAEDYLYYLDMNQKPPDGSQYRVALFVTDFIRNNISLIDENCMRYLLENTGMQF